MFYSCAERGREEREGGGAVLFCRDRFQSTPKPDSTVQSSRSTTTTDKFLRISNNTEMGTVTKRLTTTQQATATATAAKSASASFELWGLDSSSSSGGRGSGSAALRSAFFDLPETCGKLQVWNRFWFWILELLLCKKFNNCAALRLSHSSAQLQMAGCWSRALSLSLTSGATTRQVAKQQRQTSERCVNYKQQTYAHTHTHREGLRQAEQT